MLSHEEIIKQKKKRKKVLLIALGVVAGIFLLFGLIVLILSGVDAFMKNQARDSIENETKRSYVYPDPDYDYNIFEDDYYMNQTDRSVRITDGAATTVITADNYDSYSPEICFMYDVIELIIKGDYVEYNKIFTEDYIKNAGNDLRERFTMQQLFEIQLEILNYEESDSGSEIYSDIKVSYRIRNNNGTFRNDLDYNDDASLPVVYKLVSDSTRTNIKVDGLLTYYKYTSGLY